MSEIVIAYFSGVLTIPVAQYLVIPYAKKKLRERWEGSGEGKPKKHAGGRPRKNKPEEVKE